ncbi:N-acetylglucosamine kinase [Lysinibacillus cavernae]|uniref:N-acetylglucosamine kinase n=1 Tax=Lysinibacillus cavernae TaxID=2666135 RepID=UPI0012D9507A|nr:BadF/BadG/BcrA/BcrD ATPase family protein [Lysinibacillus cavernae]
MPLNRQYIIGVDGGGTRTRAVIGTKNGEVLAFVEGAGTNMKSTPPDVVRQEILKILAQLLQKAGLTKSDVSMIFLCVAGGDRYVDIARWEKWVDTIFSGTTCKVKITNDAVAALTSGTFTQEGLVVIAGTGSIVYAVEKNHHVSRVGGWGHLLGDEGSGYYIGQEALRAIAQQYDVLGSNGDVFADTILEQLAISDPTEIITLIYEHPQPRVCIASIARTVLRLAEQNNERAKDIIEKAVIYLVQLIQTMLKKEPQVSNFPIVICGGLFGNLYFVQCFQEKLQQATIHNRLILPEVPPVIGAFINGLFCEGIQMTEALQRTIKETWMSINEK